ncbi:MAG: putative permease [Planctomycetaceae bacterium]|nr:putative permease [Planctomycetaceae bacterium]
MMTLLDRYLLQRYWQAFAVTFLALFGLFVILDVFTNLDEFTRNSPGVGQVLAEMSKYYLFRACAFFESVGSFVSVMSALMALALLIRHGELNPILSAGIPSYRLAVPLMFGNVFVSMLLVANQELLIPRVAEQLQARPGQGADSADKIRPVLDFSTHVRILSGKLFLKARKLSETDFVLPAPELVTKLTTVHSGTAVYRPKSTQQTVAGWYLTDISPSFAELSLTDRGREIVLPGEGPNEVFIVTDVSFDQLVNRNKFFENLSTRELLENARNPSFGILSLRAQTVHLHSRMTRPLFNLLVVLMIVPVIIRKESRGLVVNLACSLGAMTFALGLQQCCSYLAQGGVLRLDLAAWLPVIVSGILGAWFSGFVRT